MTKTLTIITALSLGIVALAGNLSAQTALKDVAEVRDGIIVVGMAYEISEQCDSISARLFRGVLYLNSLKNRARDLGYSDEEIDAYVNDSDEKRRLEIIAREQLASLGVVQGETSTYCAVGREQIAAQTPVGQLLR